MFLHLGADYSVPLSEVIGIIDIKAGLAQDTKDFLSLARTEGKVMQITDEAPKSMVITRDQIFLSPISSVTLKRRAINFLEDK